MESVRRPKSAYVMSIITENIAHMPNVTQREHTVPTMDRVKVLIVFVILIITDPIVSITNARISVKESRVRITAIVSFWPTIRRCVRVSNRGRVCGAKNPCVPTIVSRPIITARARVLAFVSVNPIITVQRANFVSVLSRVRPLRARDTVRVL